MNKNDCTILYYTSNREDEVFESNIIRTLKKMCGNLPIISISQKPIDLGENICVGNVGTSDNNLYRQILIGCEVAKTPFVISAEADNLYPYDYFSYEPDKLDQIYRYNNVWVLKQYRSYFFKKDWCEGAQIAGREYYIDLIKKELKDRPEWIDGHAPTNPFRYLNRNWEYYGSEIPVVSIKTGKGLRANTQTSKLQVKELPYWGTTKIVRRKLGLV